jgi:hypothetical protein
MCCHVQSFSISIDHDEGDSDTSIYKQNSSLRISTNCEDSKESPQEFSENLDKSLEKFHLTRVDSNGFVSGVLKPQSAVPPRSGKSLKYFLKDKIGEGAYGKVYRSIDIETKKEVSAVLLRTYLNINLDISQPN